MASWLLTIAVDAHPLVIDDDDFFDVAVAAELVLEVGLAGADRETKDAEDGVGLGGWRMSRAPWCSFE